MTGETHRQGGLLCAVVGFVLLRKHNLLLPNVNEFVQLAVMYPFAKWGSIASDLDHHWDSCPEKDPPSWFVNKVLHLTTPLAKGLDKAGQKNSMGYKVAKFFSASHRSWQTHSDLTLAGILYLLWAVMTNKFSNVLTSMDVSILSLMLAGICIGVIAHFILDMLTPEGVWCTPTVLINKMISVLSHKEKHILPEKYRFVPHMKVFATGGAWETFIRRVLKVATVVSILYVLLVIVFPDTWSTIKGLFPYEISFN